MTQKQVAVENRIEIKEDQLRKLENGMPKPKRKGNGKQFING